MPLMGMAGALDTLASQVWLCGSLYLICLHPTSQQCTSGLTRASLCFQQYRAVC